MTVKVALDPDFEALLIVRCGDPPTEYEAQWLAARDRMRKSWVDYFSERGITGHRQIEEFRRLMKAPPPVGQVKQVYRGRPLGWSYRYTKK